MNNQKRDNVSMVFITCCMVGLLVRRLPFAAFKCIKLQRPLAANGIQRSRLKNRAVLNELNYQHVKNII